MSKVIVKRLELFKEFYGIDSPEAKLLEKVLLIESNDEVFNLVNSILQNIETMIAISSDETSTSIEGRFYNHGYLKASKHILGVVNELIDYYSKGVE